MKKIWIALGLVMLAACSKITVENYQKMNIGMNRTEVVALMGEPTQTEAGSLFGIKGETATWNNGKISINAQFVNEKLLTHAMIKE